MQLSMRQARSQKPKAEGSSPLGRAIRYLGRYPRLTALAYAALFVATAAQLAVPQLVQNIIDAIINNSTRKTILENMPAGSQQTMAEGLGLNPATLQLDLDNATRVLVWAAVLIVIFSIMRGLFTFA